MVWESGCVVIVMLTPLSENGVKQCHHYWPDEGSDVYHIYEVIEKAVKQKGHERHVFPLQLVSNHAVRFGFYVLKFV